MLKFTWGGIRIVSEGRKGREVAMEGVEAHVSYWNETLKN
jgi:hypothetical protein